MGFKLTASVAIAILAIAGCAAPKGGNPDAKREYVRQMHDDTLQLFYNARPALRRTIQHASGYAVFSNLDVGVFIVQTGHGYGIAHNNLTGDDTYMRVAELGAGLGLGIKDFRAVLVFHNAGSYQRFVDTGLEFGVMADVAAMAGGDKGLAAGTQGQFGSAGRSVGAAGAVGVGQANPATSGSVGSGVEIYELTKNGLALRAALAGTKYWKDGGLNY
jgi:lipid-binding SYLF domain-containing protein